MKYVVTGGVGFIGSHLVERLLGQGHKVLVIDNLESIESQKRIDNGDLKDWDSNPNISILYQDITTIENFSIFEGSDAIFHLAALPRVKPSIDDPIKYHQTNVNGTLNMLFACVKARVRKFIFSSSSSVYGDAEIIPTIESSDLNPKSPYSLHKLIGEQYCKLFENLYGIRTISLRYFNVYGERQPLSGAYSLVMGIFANQILQNKPLTINGDGEQRRDFVYVGDVVDANILSLSLEKNDENIFNIGSGINFSVIELADLLDENSTRINNAPLIEPRETLADISRAKNILKWRPRTELKDWVKIYKNQLGIDL
tara:strand:- start:8991 stop:9929 length:939 start_codon:yes stop_codon:yes gene_type:complete